MFPAHSVIPNESTYDLISKTAYLSGVSKRIFENEYAPPQQEIFSLLNKDSHCRIVRNLCLLRAQLVCNYKLINDAMRTGLCSILTLPQYVSPEVLQQLTADGVPFFKKSNRTINQHVMEINRLLSDRINNCKKWFPDWLKWDYLRSLFVTPALLTEQGIKAAAQTYYTNRDRLPYQVYINFVPIEGEGNLFSSDRRFVERLYESHNDYFTDYNKVSDAGRLVKENIYQFLAASQRVVLLCDCENSDVFKLCAAFKSLQASELQKIGKIILFDDIHTSSGWELLSEEISIPVEHMVIPRLKRDKSLVDPMLVSRCCMEHYKNHADAFVLVSSDSDYWALVSSLPQARFLFLVERENFGTDLKAALTEHEISYCYLDEFCSGHSEAIRTKALLKEISQTLDQALHLNLNEVFVKAMAKARLTLTPREQRQFYQKYLQTICLVIREDGSAKLALNRK